MSPANTSRSPREQVCVVTGAARGLGNEFCRAFVQSGCTSLAIVDLKEEEAEHAAEELVKAACGQYRVFNFLYPFPASSRHGADKV